MADIEPLASISDRLLKERHALLDLSTRNRLLNTPLRTRNNRAIEIVDEKSAEVFRLLDDGKALSFLPGVKLSEEERGEFDPDDDVTGGIPQPDEETVDARGVAGRHSDLRLQTRLTTLRRVLCPRLAMEVASDLVGKSSPAVSPAHTLRSGDIVRVLRGSSTLCAASSGPSPVAIYVC